MYWKVGTEIEDSFYLEDIDGTAETGKVQSNFDIDVLKDQTGNQGSTGITITEVDASNNPGWYAFQVDSSTGFVADAGSYAVRLAATGGSGTTLVVTGKYVVTEDGTGSGTVGAASFTATSGDGRVTDGTSPVEDAVVYLKNSAGSLITQVTTDSSGLWGPVYLDESVTAYAQKDAYSQAAGSITVSGTTATGPGSDLELTAVTSSLTASALWAYARRVAHNTSGTLADQVIKELVNDALDRVSAEYHWNYLTRYTTVAIEGSYSTGTVSISQGSTTVTLSGGTFPSWAASGQLEVSGKVYNVSSRDSNTQLTLETSLGQGDLTDESYVLYQDSYSLPTDCISFKSLHYGTEWSYGHEPVSFDEFMRAKSGLSFSGATASCFTVQYGKLWLYPYPSTDTDVMVAYRKRIGTLTSSGDSVDWQSIHRNVLNRAIDLEIAIRYGETAGGLDMEACQRAYESAVRAAVANDQKVERRSPRPRTGTGRSRTALGSLNLPDAT